MSGWGSVTLSPDTSTGVVSLYSFEPNVDFTNALLMESNFEGAKIDGADFTDAVISRIQQKELCAIANGTNSSTGESTDYSLGC